MGISAKPIGKFRSIMTKIENQKAAEAKTIKQTVKVKEN